MITKNWLELDNAAQIFPAIRRANWVNTFRVSVNLTDPVDPVCLQQAVNDLKDRFPSLYVKLGSGLFWYFLEQTAAPPPVQQDYAYPLTHMSAREQAKCCFRVFYYRNRIAVEFFHALTDGSGAMVYLKTLTAQYLRRKYGIFIPNEKGVLNPVDLPRAGELEDAFLDAAGDFPASRKEEDAFRLRGTREPSGFNHLLTGVLPTDLLVRAAKKFNVTVTAFLSGVLIESILAIQKQSVPDGREKPVKITIPVNLRNLFPSETLRNFALVVNLGVDPRLGDYSLQEICTEVKNQMQVEITPKKMASRIASNVRPQQAAALRAAPRFIKTFAMRMVYSSVGESKGCLNLSNLGQIKTPAEMEPYIDRFDFIIGVQYTYPNNCSVASYKNTTCINFIRNIRETDLEQRFFSRLVELGIPVKVESNDS